MITLKYKQIVCKEDKYGCPESYIIFESENIYAYSIQYIDEEPFHIFYSIKNPEEKCGIRIYHIDFNDSLKYLILNGIQIWPLEK